MRFKTTSFFLISFFSVISVFGQTLPTVTEVDGVSNDSPALAVAITTLPAKVKGSIYNPFTDVDYYSFSAQAGDKIFANCMTSFSPGNQDAILTLFASDGVTVIETDNDDGSISTLSPSIAGAVIPSSGTYYIRVTGNSTSAGIRPYILYLNAVRGAATPEVEPNDVAGSATPMSGNMLVSGSLSSPTDADIYSMSLTAGETVFISLDLDPERDATTWNGQVLFGVFGSGNTSFVVNDASTTSPNSEALPFTVLNSGTYYFVVNAPSGVTTVGTYQLAVARFAATPGYSNYAGATNLPLTIPNAANSNVSSSITIPTSGRIKDISINIDLTSSAMGDLDILLTGPDGTVMSLMTDICSATFPTMRARFNDNAAVPPVFTLLDGVVFTPENNSWLSGFKNSNSQGTWTLTIHDDTNNTSTGTLNSWSIDILTEPDNLFGGTLVYGNDFEANDGGMTHSGTADSWAYGTPTSAPLTTAFSGTKCWKTNLTGTYPASSTNTLVTPEIDLTGVSTGTSYVKWAMKSQIESASFDFFKITAEEVGGLNRVVELFNWYGATQTTTLGTAGGTIQLSNAWSVNYADVSIFNGSKFVLKFNLITDTTVQLAGVAIDDIYAYKESLLSTDDFSEKFNARLFPNPASDKLTIALNQQDFKENMKYKVYDLNGRELQSNAITSLETIVGLESLSSGIYLIEVSSDTSKMVKRIIKN
ncbi:T9SS type A sorting domain-containing protein [Flavobacterium sp. GCM10027622]|uniref:T9SS type A sorting domain-containing protein n=1 Tax=unclassified Flavobacterium TaxID=196869 RepID=UPI003620C93B